MTKVPVLEPAGSRLVSLRQVSGAGLANVFYLGLQSLLFLVLTPLVLHALGPEVFGLWTILAAIAGFASLANFGIGAGVTKYVSEFAVAEEAGTRISAVVSFGFLFLLASGLVTGVLLFFLRHWISGLLAPHPYDSSQLSRALVVISCGIAPTFLTQLPKGILFGLVCHKVVGGVDVAQSACLLGAALIIGWHGGGIVPLAFSLVLINLAFLVILLLLAWRAVRAFSLYFSLNRAMAREILGYSFFAWISGLGSLLFTQADRILVGLLLGPAAAGAYAICTGVAARLNALAGSATQVLVPFASSYQAYGKKSEIAKVFLHLLRLMGCLMATIGIVLIFWSKWILSVWISPQFSLAYSSVFDILVLAYALFSIFTPGYYIAFGLGRPELPALANIGGSLLMLGLISILSPVLGLRGAALANLSCSLELGVIFLIARQVLMIDIASIIRNIFLPISLLLFSFFIVNIFTLSTVFSFIINFLLLITLTWFALGEGRLSIILKTIRINK